MPLDFPGAFWYNFGIRTASPVLAFFAGNMEQPTKRERKLHLKLPTSMLAAVLRPTGCRNSSEAEASWRLEAAAVAVRVLEPKGLFPIFRDTEEYRDGSPVSELHIPLREEDLQLLTEISNKEGGSRGELARQLILATQRIVENYPGTLSHDGLVAEMISQFLPLSDLLPAEW